MKKKSHIVSYTADEINSLIAQGKDLTDWKKVDSMTDANILAVCDEDDYIGAIDWDNIQIGLPKRKKAISIMLDSDLLEWFKKNGKGYQTKINAILRSYMQSTPTLNSK
jgi:uncharacterized protein (DUF4415 family)